ncbi:hypothetical protein ACF09K_14305 [Streptomyces sp. NPDC014882]|uniref:hypothetical protein n=1 Tax=Streptomyces sp. NPDC014882 TaxID=3364927 RepID=UPI0036F96137
MGIESDQVVYEYLSRVGDVAQQRQLSSATRMRLVSELRDEIDRRRARAPVDSPAAVRRILDRLGSPDEVVSAAGGVPGDAAPQAPPAAVPVQRQQEPPDTAGRRPRGLRRVVPRPRPRPDAPAAAPDVPSPPHRAGAHELGGGGETPDWWRREATPFGVGEEVPGFVGGVEIADMLRPPPSSPPSPSAKEKAPPATPVPEPGPEEPAARRRFLPPLPGGRLSNPLLLLAAACLVAGTVTGQRLALPVGWAIAYVSRRLSDRETKTAVMVLPGLSATAGVVWLWGRTAGRWGDPIPEGHMNEALAQTWPWVLNGAALASALFLVWRSQRTR